MIATKPDSLPSNHRALLADSAGAGRINAYPRALVCAIVLLFVGLCAV